MAASILSLYIDGLAPIIAKEIGLLRGLKEELSSLKQTMSMIESVLVDAEKKQVKSNQVWLTMLEDVFYEADDLMDEVNIEALRLEVMTGSDIAKQVRTFFSSSNQLGFQHKMNSKIIEIKKRLNEIRHNKDMFGFDISHQGSDQVVTRVANSFVREEEVFGRDADRDAIINLLLINGDHKIEEEVVPVAAIAGYGGSGKTTLAQLVFNNPAVQKRFHRRVWVYASPDFDMRKLLHKIAEPVIGYGASGLSEYEIIRSLGKKLKKKGLLIVLDDVWIAENEWWSNLKAIFSSFKSRCSIIITTRSQIVAKSASTMDPYVLSNLDESNAWLLFTKIAFHGEEPNNSSSIDMGKQILKMLGGNPLAIKTIGSALYSKSPITGWPSFLRMESSELYQKEYRPILASLKVSYDYLPSHLKHCFAYCSIFPKEFEIDVKTLVNLWMAQSLVSSSPGQHVEDVGYEYFQDLCSIFFFQEVEKDENGIVTKCKMPNLMQDLAVFVAGERFVLLKENDEHKVDRRTHHISFRFHSDLSSEILTSLVRAKRTRTIFLPNQLHRESEGRLSESEGRLIQSICDKIVSNCKLLRVLDLHNSGITRVLHTISNSKHLRYLDLSQNTALKSLPNSITMLHYLMVLKLSSCYGLQNLPRDMKKLVNLKHLEIDWCYNLTHLPSGMGQLTQLQTLSEFALSKSTDSCSLDELAQLNNLTGELKVKNLEIERHYKAGILEGKDLRSLTLAWEFDANVDADASLKLLECLKPNTNLKELALVGYGGFKFSDWLSSLRNLVKFSLRKSKCQYLSALNQLSCLKVLILDEMPNLKYISDKSENEYSSSSTNFFPYLEELRLTELRNLEGWWAPGSSVATKTATSLPSFPRLSKLIIEDCPKLSTMPLYSHLEKWLVLDNTSLETFIQTMNYGASLPLSNLETLCIIGIKTLDISYGDQIKWECLGNLQFLRFDYLPKLETLPEGLRQVTTLRELHIWRCNMKTLPEWIGNFKSLKRLGISVCPYLNSLPEGVRSLSSLETLEIVDCPILLQRCQTETGADWDKIKHIPYRLLHQPQSSLSSSNIRKLQQKSAVDESTPLPEAEIHYPVPENSSDYIQEHDFGSKPESSFSQPRASQRKLDLEEKIKNIELQQKSATDESTPLPEAEIHYPVHEDSSDYIKEHDFGSKPESPFSQRRVSQRQLDLEKKIENIELQQQSAIDESIPLPEAEIHCPVPEDSSHYTKELDFGSKPESSLSQPRVSQRKLDLEEKIKNIEVMVERQQATINQLEQQNKSFQELMEYRVYNVRDVSQAEEAFLAWPRNLVNIPSTGEENMKKTHAKGKEPAVATGLNATSKSRMSPTHGNMDDDAVDDDASLSMITMPIHELLKRIGDVQHKLDWTFHLMKGTVGDEQDLVISNKNIKEFCDMKELSYECILFYIRHLYNGLKGTQAEGNYCFVHPGYIANVQSKNPHERLAIILSRWQDAKPFQLWLFPYWSNEHWMLGVVDPYLGEAWFYDSLGRYEHPDFKNLINKAFLAWNTGKSKAPKIQWHQTKTPKQPGYVECGYYVMMIMRDIVRRNVQRKNLRSMYDNVTWGQIDVNQFRKEWESSMNTCICQIIKHKIEVEDAKNSAIFSKSLASATAIVQEFNLLRNSLEKK